MIIANIAEVIASASQLSYNDIVTVVLVVDECKVVYHHSQDTANLEPRGYSTIIMLSLIYQITSFV